MDKKEIRFIDSHYNELFRIPDGSEITIQYPDGHKENRVCKYIDDYHFYLNNLCFHICQFAELMEQNNQTYSPANTEKYKLEHITQDEFEFMFAPKDKNTERGCVGYVRADFGTGKEFYTSWFGETEALKTDEFRQELDDVINYFRESTKTPLLKGRSDMHNVCFTLKPTAYIGNGEIKGFKVVTDKHTYYLKCKPHLGDYDLYFYGYNSQQLLKYRDLQFINEHYADIGKDKFFKRDYGLMEVYFNPDSTEGGQFVTHYIDIDDMREAAKHHGKSRDFFSNIAEVSKCELCDVGTADFRSYAEWFMGAKADFEGCTDKTMKAIKKYAGVEKVKPPKEPER